MKTLGKFCDVVTSLSCHLFIFQTKEIDSLKQTTGKYEANDS